MPKLGWLPDPPKAAHEKPDFDAEPLLKAAPPPPPSASIRHLVTDILNQGSLGSCVANAILQAVRCSHVKQGVQNPKLGSRLFGYFLSRSYHVPSDAANDTGTYLRLFFQSLAKFGFCPEGTWPYDDGADKFKQMPPTKAFRSAFDQANPTTYRRISASGDDRIESIKLAIAAGYGVCFGTDVDNAFCSNQLVEPLMPPTKDIAGGHAMMVGGYDGDVFEIVNSWGTNWGDNGWCNFSADYLTADCTRDLWICEYAPKYSE
jgi:C1A family cysteine protease